MASIHDISMAILSFLRENRSKFIYNVCQDEELIKVTPKYLSRMLRVDAPLIGRAIHVLKDRGYIRIVEYSGRKKKPYYIIKLVR